MSTDDPSDAQPRQRIVQVPGSRRVRLTPAPGAQEEPVDEPDSSPESPPTAGANDERLRRDVPPHY